MEKALCPQWSTTLLFLAQLEAALFYEKLFFKFMVKDKNNTA